VYEAFDSIVVGWKVGSAGNEMGDVTEFGRVKGTMCCAVGLEFGCDLGGSCVSNRWANSCKVICTLSQLLLGVDLCWE